MLGPARVDVVLNTSGSCCTIPVRESLHHCSIDFLLLNGHQILQLLFVAIQQNMAVASSTASDLGAACIDGRLCTAHAFGPHMQLLRSMQVPRAAGAVLIAPAVDTLLTALQRESQLSGRDLSIPHLT